MFKRYECFRKEKRNEVKTLMLTKLALIGNM